VAAYDSFLERRDLRAEVFNIGGGPRNALSLLELLSMLQRYTRKRAKVRYSEWRPTDQKVYVSNITRAKKVLHWEPAYDARRGVQELISWVQGSKAIF